MQLTVLMSTYNGEKYLRKQLDSILAQQLPEGVRLGIKVRDDGSTDSTVDILNEYVRIYGDTISYYSGENIRSARSFWDLLKNSPQSDFYAFSDQDDFWYPDKLKRAIEALQSEFDQDIPLLYSSNVTVGDAELYPIAAMNTERMHTDLAHVLIYCVSHGCTQVFNNFARDEFIKYDMDNNLAVMHDRMADLIAILFGKLIYDETPSMLYRQHGNNVCGEQSVSKIKSFWKRAMRFWRHEGYARSEISRMLIELYADRLNAEQKRVLSAVGYYKTDKKARKTLMKDKAFSKGKKADRLLRLAVRFNRI